MAQQVMRRHGETLICSVCLDVLKDPVTIPCGHSFCMSCIKACWDQTETHSCPLCRQSFQPRPVLVKNTMLAELVEEVKKEGLQAASPHYLHTGSGEVACDYCTDMRREAFKSCLVCMSSFCEQHLQPHYSVALLKKHTLVDATFKLQKNICSRHDEVMKVYCHNDQQCICYLCSMDDHKGHDTVSAAAERAEMQTELRGSRIKIQQRIQDAEKDVRGLQQRVEVLNLSADEAERDIEKFSTKSIQFIEISSSEVKKRIRAQQETQVGGARELEEKLQQKITELQRRDTELEKLFHTQDHLHFINSYSLLSHLNESQDEPLVDVHPRCSFNGVTAAVLEAREKLQAVQMNQWMKITQTVTKVDLLVRQAEPRTRPGFLRHSGQITLDSTTAHKRLSLSERSRRVTLQGTNCLYVNHPDRYRVIKQVLSREGLTGRCYWEVKWAGKVYIAVAYKNTCRTGTRNECGFGEDDKSWALICESGGFKFRHNKVFTSISGPQSSRVGVYLDHEAGRLSFYRVSVTMTLLHRVQTTFTHPLHAGFRIPQSAGDSAVLCEL